MTWMQSGGASAKPAGRTTRRHCWAASFVIVTVVFAVAGCVRGQPSETTTHGLTTQGSNAAMFEVTTTHPDYWRLFTLDRVDGMTWMPPGAKGVALSTPATLPGSPTSGPGSASTSDTFRILSGFDQDGALPIPPTASELDGPAGSISWDQGSNRVSVAGGASEGMEYTVHAASTVPTPEELDQTSAASSDGRWTELPADIDPRFRRIAERWTAGATSDYRKVLAIQERFQRDDFTYSTDVPAPHGFGEVSGSSPDRRWGSASTTRWRWPSSCARSASRRGSPLGSGWGPCRTTGPISCMRRTSTSGWKPSSPATGGSPSNRSPERRIRTRDKQART